MLLSISKHQSSNRRKCISFCTLGLLILLSVCYILPDGEIHVISRQLSKLSPRERYDDYYPPAIEEFMVANRCPDNVRNYTNREITSVEKHDQLFRNVLSLYDGVAHLHHKQKFMGSRMGQFPFDLHVITELLYDVKPDLIIETGTNAGGSALYMSVMMQAFNPDCKILTVDTMPLQKWATKFGGEDPTVKKPWEERITFVQKHSDNKEFLQLAKTMAAEAKTVLVILDSHHEAKTVWDEMMQLCVPLATNNSYCLVEDTILKTPVDALRNFFKTEMHRDFCIDTDREFMGLTQHRGGYLRRIDTQHKQEVDPLRLKQFTDVFRKQYVHRPKGDLNRNNLQQKRAVDIATEFFLNYTSDAV